MAEKASRREEKGNFLIVRMLSCSRSVDEKNKRAHGQVLVERVELESS